MPFNTGYLSDPVRVGAGERFDPKADFILTAITFEDGLNVGRFAKLDTGSLDNLDGSATPTLAGIVLRKGSNPVEDGATIDADLYGQVEYARKGAITVSVKTGETPAQFDPVYVSNAPGSYGQATATNTDLASGGWEFIEEVKPGVWLVSK